MRKWLLLAIISSLCWVGCNRQALEDDGQLRVAMVLKTLNNPFFISLQNGAESAAKELGLNLTVQAPEREVDVEKQMQIIENLIQTRVDAILVAPSGSREILPSILKANEAGIPVLIIDTQIDNEAAREMGVRTETFVGSDNYEGGRVAGEYIVHELEGRGSVVILEGIPGHETGDSRLHGFLAALEGKPGIEVVASQPANWERDQGFNVTQNLLQANAAVDALFACNDMMALGALEAIAAAGRSDEVIVVGFDAVEDAREAIATGQMRASVAQYPDQIGKLSVESAAQIMEGRSVPDYVPVPIELITIEKLHGGNTESEPTN